MKLPFRCATQGNRSSAHQDAELQVNTHRNPAYFVFLDTGQAAAEETQAKHDHLNLLINAAGILHIPDVLSPGTGSDCNDLRALPVGRNPTQAMLLQRQHCQD